MAHGRTTIEIERPAEAVFAVLADVELNARWSRASVEGHNLTPGPVGVGTTAREVSMFLGRRIDVTSEVIEFEPGRRLAYVTRSGPFPFRGSFVVEPITGGSRVTATFEARPDGILRHAEWLFTALATRQFRGDLGNLKRLMEAGELTAISEGAPPRIE